MLTCPDCLDVGAPSPSVSYADFKNPVYNVLLLAFVHSLHMGLRIFKGIISIFNFILYQISWNIHRT